MYDPTKTEMLLSTLNSSRSSDWSDFCQNNPTIRVTESLNGKFNCFNYCLFNVILYQLKANVIHPLIIVIKVN